VLDALRTMLSVEPEALPEGASAERVTATLALDGDGGGTTGWTDSANVGQRHLSGNAPRWCAPLKVGGDAADN
jgi:hypothetical protein